MNGNILGYISTVNTAIWTIPLVISIWMLIKKKFKFKYFVAGIFSYLAVYVIQQLLLIAVSLPLGKIANDNLVGAVAVYATAIPPAAVFGTCYIYNRVVEDKSWYTAIGYGLGLGYATLISELGMKLLSNMFMAFMIIDGDVPEMSAEQLKIYQNAENMLKTQTGGFYISVGFAAVMIFAATIVNVLLLRKYNESKKKFPLLLSYALYVCMYALFTVAVYAAIENLAVIILMTAVIIFSIYYLTKSYDAQDTETEYISRPSPLLGRNIDKRYKTKKKK